MTSRLEAGPDRSRAGLSSEEARVRLERFGPNELPEQPSERWWTRLARNLREPMSLLLLVAAAVSGFALGERLDALVILAIVALNAVIGVVQEGRAGRALEVLRQMETPTARVVRDGRGVVIPAAEVVPGDAVLLSAGDRVPADLRLVEASSFEVDESMLTGESLPVQKDPAERSADDAALGERPDAAFTGTLVTRGTGRGVVRFTGADTTVGAIAARLQEPASRTPLQAELTALTGRLGLIAVAVSALVFGLTLLRTGLDEGSFARAFLTAVALAVAAVPEGLATVVTVALALEVRRMAARGAIVRRLPAVETLGSTTLILTDKTGTLTENRMRLDSVVPGDGERRPAQEVAAPVLAALAEAAVLCNDAPLGGGDPVDVALLEAFDGSVGDAPQRLPRIEAVPFESARQRMTTLHRASDGLLLLVKGAPEVVLDRCNSRLDGRGRRQRLDEASRARLVRRSSELAFEGGRLLALARRSLVRRPAELDEAEREMTFVALVVLRDPVRAQAPAAVAEAREAGIRLVMVTGDHAGTASSVARRVGLGRGDVGVVSGAGLRAGEAEPDPSVADVFARVDPDQKLELVEHARAHGEVVAVTGDGVNDAPALRRADIGVAMGRTGSDVAREAADLVVTDDDLATIVIAVREGRGIYDNIRKVVDYLIGGNLSEIIVVIGALLLFPELGVPLLPLQLLWINLLTDGLPALALGSDAVDPGLMRRPPRSPDQGLLTRSRMTLLSARAAIMGAAAIGALAVARFGFDHSWHDARATMFTVLVAEHLLYAFVARRPTRGLNLWLLAAVAGGILLQLAITLWPPAREVFDTAPLSREGWLLVATAAVAPVSLMLGVEAARGRLRTA